MNHPAEPGVSEFAGGNEARRLADPEGWSMGLRYLLRDLIAPWRRRSDGAGTPSPRRPGRRGRPRFEGLEARRVLTSPVPPLAIMLDSVSTPDSRGVTVDYDVNVFPDAVHPFAIGVYRSADDRFDGNDAPLAESVLNAPGRGQATVTLDDQGQPAALPGHHTLTIPVPGGLTLNPSRPYVLAVANPADASTAGDPRASASFHTHIIGVVTHGGLQDKHDRNGPAWELEMARSLRREGYDVVIPYNWVSQSNNPGAAARQKVRLARLILRSARHFPATEPVDLHLIGHSEGTVVNSRALIRLTSRMPVQLRDGFVKITMLDPHAASNGVRGQQYSTASNPLGWIAKGSIDAYQSKSNDPGVVVPPVADEAEVFYQHTPASRAGDSNGGIYNLWGQVPVRGPASYFNLTQDGATHSGKTGVVAWYQRNVVPLLRDGAPEVQERVLTGSLAPDDAAATPRSASRAVTRTHHPTFTGRALSRSTVYLFGGPARSPSTVSPIARTRVDGDDRWQASTRRLSNGRYRIVAVAVPPRARPDSGPRLPVLPTAPLGALLVRAGRSA
jgi:hypothetical protein